MKPLTDEDRKRLTLYLGECAHEVANPVLSSPQPCIKCGVIPYKDGVYTGRKFTTYEDLGKLKDKLVENGEWVEFETWAYRKWVTFYKTAGEEAPFSFTLWLFRPESCGLVAEYLEQKENSKDMEYADAPWK